ncbi:MAG: hypothetical protein PHN84_11655 [Desulfuromonadaceae bacterium]|nr:hypothetical protein [Desulfuromonadaceae bacterium]MDD2856590.1 hypothetical protein [Desulfuromonadaceae bacterium]
MKRTVICTGVILSLGFSGACFAQKSSSLSGADLLEKRCSTCHPSARPKGLKKSAKDWEKTVQRMMGKGAMLSNDEKKVLVDHLSKTYK